VLSATAITVTTEFYPTDIDGGAGGARASLLPMLLPAALPILILIVPLADLMLAVVRRTAAGRSPFAPDKQHLHHRLLEIGHSHRRAVLIMWLWAGWIGFGTVFASLYDDLTVWICIGVAFVVTVALTFVVPFLPHWGRRGAGSEPAGPAPGSRAPETL
jgi:UDP-GlcNAc:undecaprenyl-phosphate GlcNAc-1-phosphate transferase